MTPPDTAATDCSFMDEALSEARLAAEAGEVPVGAVAVHDGRIIARARNRVEEARDATCHAEMELLRRCAAELGDWRMENVDFFVTKEPCAMCAGALVNARVRRVVYGVPDPRSGACGSALNITGFPGMLWQVEAAGGVRAEEARSILQEFFRRVRTRSTQKDAQEKCSS